MNKMVATQKAGFNVPIGNKQVIFDFDGTLIKKESLHIFLIHLRRTGQIGLIPYVKLLLWFVSYRLGFSKKPEKAMVYAFSFLRGRNVIEFARIAESFADEVLLPAISTAARRLVQEHIDNGDDVMLVSNSLDLLVSQVAKSLGIRNHIATSLEIENGLYTGKLQGTPIYGNAKAVAITNYVAKHNLSLENSIAYCNHDSDLAVFKMVKTPVVVNPVPRLLQIAKLRGWQIITL